MALEIKTAVICNASRFGSKN